jgi:hypothetical protein
MARCTRGVSLRSRHLVIALVVLLVGAAGGLACGDDESPSGDVDTPSVERVVLAAPPGTPAATLTAAADVVRTRLARMGVTDAEVAPSPSGVAVHSSADGYQLWAASQPGPAAIAPIVSTSMGPCQGGGQPTIGPASRCVVLGPTATGTSAVVGPSVVSAKGAGWRLAFNVDPGQYQAFRDALGSDPAAPMALTAGDGVVLVFEAGLPAQRSTIGPPLAEETARLAAAVLMLTDALPVALTPPELGTGPGPRVDVDFWTAALGVDVCGTWLPNAPSFGLETGLHSHGDGLIYVHPMTPDEAGDHATVGLFLERGGWNVSDDEVEVWDGEVHRVGDRCPNGEVTKVRWWLDGVEQRGDLDDHVPRNGQVIVVSFDADGSTPGIPPQASSLTPPRLRADI